MVSFRWSRITVNRCAGGPRQKKDKEKEEEETLSLITSHPFEIVSPMR